MITAGANYTAQLEQDVGTKPVYLVDCDFSTGHRRFALWHHDVIYDGDTYVGLGPVSEVEPPQASQGTPLHEQFLRFFVQNDPTLLADLQQNSRGRMCDGYLVFLGSDGTPVNSGEAIHLWHKRMIPGSTYGDAGTYGADLALESRFHRHKNRAPRTYSHATQQQEDATDFSFIDSGKSFNLSRGKWRQKSGLA